MPDYYAVNKARGAVKVLYNSQKQYEQITGDFKMLREWKVRIQLASTCAMPLLCSRSHCTASSFTDLCSHDTTSSCSNLTWRWRMQAGA